MQDDVLSHLEWEPDCQGKWNFDGRIVRLDTRYWPASYGGLPSAHAGLYLLDEYEPFVETEVEGDTLQEVREGVEAWARQEIERVVSLLRG